MIKNITLENFRLFSNKTIDINRNLVIIKGANAVGKTSILEAIYLVATSKSHRTNNFLEMLRQDANYGLVKITADKTLEVRFDKNSKYYFINRQKVSNLDFIGNLRVIIFSPLDLNIISGSKSARRKFIDSAIATYSGKYMTNMLQFKKILRKRNELLKSSQKNTFLLNSLDKLLVPLISKINHERHSFITLLNQEIKLITTKLKVEDILVDYNESLEEQIIQNELLKNKARDEKYRSTTYGPHLTDIKIALNLNDSRKFASQGQQRTAAIVLKLALLNILLKKGFKPILLLDDVFAELDQTRQSALVSYLGNSQTFITTTSLIEIPDYLLERAEIIELEKGR